MSGTKRFFFYLLSLVGIVFLVAVIMFAIMFFSPGTQVLGFVYLNYNKTQTEEYVPYDLTVGNKLSLKINANTNNLVIVPNDQVATNGNYSKNILVTYKQAVTGIVKATESDISYTTRMRNVQFEGNSDKKRTLEIEVNEPEVWSVKRDSFVYVYLPSGFKFDVIYAKSTGNIGFRSSSNLSGDILTDDLHLISTNNGKIDINNTTNIKNYYLETSNGNVNFMGNSDLSSDTLTFTSKRGTFSLSSGSLTVENGLTINSYDSVGAKVNLNKVVGDITINANGGRFTFGTIGEVEKQGRLNLNTSNANLDVSTLYGVVKLIANGENVKNNISITNLLNNTGEETNVVSGEGSVRILTMTGDGSFDATTGGVFIGNVDCESSLNIYSTYGNIEVVYEEMEKPTVVTNSEVNIFTYYGDITLSHIMAEKCNVKVLKSSAGSSVNLGFYAVGEINVEGKDRDINVVLQGSRGELMCNIFSNSLVNFASNFDNNSKVEAGDADYELSHYAYENQYRVGYPKPENSAILNISGKIFVKSSRLVYVSQIN